MAQATPQQINVGDLDISQLADVRRQLEEVSCANMRAVVMDLICAPAIPGIEPSHELVRSAQGGGGEVQGVH